MAYHSNLLRHTIPRGKPSRIGFTLFLSFLLFIMGSAQVATCADDIAWVRRYNGQGNGMDVARAIVVDASGNVYVTGYSYGGATSNYDYATIKYSPLGESLWAVRYNYANNADSACAIAIDDAGYVYVTGASWSGSTSQMDYATIKYDSIGNQKWVARYNYANGNDYARAITVDDLGNVYVTGYGESTSTNYDYVTIKYKSNGDTVWVKKYKGPGNGNDYAYAIAVDGSGNVYVTGCSYGGSIPRMDYATIKYDSMGNQKWVKRYNYANNADSALAIAIDNSANVYVTGASWGGSSYRMDYATIKYNSSGDSVWAVRYNYTNEGDDYARAIVVDGNKNVYVTGPSTGSGSGYDYATIKYNSSGVQQWVVRYNGPGNGEDRAYAIAVSSTMRNVYVTGASWGGTNMDYAAIKYYSSGNVVSQEKEWRYDNGGNDYGYAIAYDGNVYVTGTSYGGSSTGYDYLTIKYTPPVGVEEDEEIVGTDLLKLGASDANLKVCPTFGGEAQIRYSLLETGKVTLRIFDVSGRVIKTLVDDYKAPGVYTVTWDGRDEQGNKIRSGVYFLMLKAQGSRVKRKILLLRDAKM